MASSPLPRTLQPPPELPSDPKMSDTLAQYLRTFSLWCRHGFADKLSVSMAAPQITMQTEAVPPAAYQLKVTSKPTITLTPIALGTGDPGTPVELATSSDLSNYALKTDLNGYLPLTGGTLSGVLTANADIAALSGITMGSAVAPSATNVSRHLDLYGGAYGLSITAGTLNLVSNGSVALSLGSGSNVLAGDLTVSGNETVNAALVVASTIRTSGGLVQVYANTATSNAHCWFYDNTGASKAVVYWEYSANSLILAHVSSGQAISLTSDGACHLPQDVYCGLGVKCKPGMNGAFRANRAIIDYNGSSPQIWIDATNFGSFPSDYRIKKGARPLGSMWERVKALKPVTYTHRDYTPPNAVPNHGETKPKPLVIGDDKERWSLVAHEVQETLIEDAATGVKDQEDCVQSLNPAPIIAALTKALQEAMARIEALEAAR